MDLTQILSRLDTATPDALQVLTNIFVPVTFKKGMVLTSSDQPCSKLYYIASGLVRGYFFYNNEEHTCWILEQGFLAPVAHPDGSGQAVEYIGFLTETHGWALNLNKAEVLAQKDPSMYRMLLEIYQDIILEGKARELMLRIQTADEKYQYIEQKNEPLLFKLNNQILASLLNIKLKYLYKVKKRQRER